MLHEQGGQRLTATGDVSRDCAYPVFHVVVGNRQVDADEAARPRLMWRELPRPRMRQGDDVVMFRHARIWVCLSTASGEASGKGTAARPRFSRQRVETHAEIGMGANGRRRRPV